MIIRTLQITKFKELPQIYELSFSKNGKEIKKYIEMDEKRFSGFEVSLIILGIKYNVIESKTSAKELNENIEKDLKIIDSKNSRDGRERSKITIKKLLKMKM